MDKERLSKLKNKVNVDYTNRHDSPQMYFSLDDLKWLIEQAENIGEIKTIINRKDFDGLKVLDIKEIINQ